MGAVVLKPLLLPRLQMMSPSGAGGAGGGGLDLGSMMSSMMPMMGDLLGSLGGGAPGAGHALALADSMECVTLSLCLNFAVAAGAGRGGGGAARPQSLEEVLAALPAGDADRWRATLANDAQSAAPAQPPFSEAYISALPPAAAAGILRQGDDE